MRVPPVFKFGDFGIKKLNNNQNYSKNMIKPIEDSVCFLKNSNFSKNKSTKK